MFGYCNVKTLYTSFTKTFDKIASQEPRYKRCSKCITAVISACDDGLHKKWTEEYVRRSSHELMHEIALMRHAGAFGYGRRMLH